MAAEARPAAPVLVVDDDALARELVTRYFEKLNLHNPVVHARDGVEACEFLEAGNPPALVLLDLHMPRRTGLEVLEWIRGDAELCSIPVVMLTGSSEMEEIDQAYSLGISSYLVKPVGFSALQDVLSRLGLPWTILAPPIANR